MVQEIFIVEDKNEIINELKPHFKANTKLSLRSVHSR